MSGTVTTGIRTQEPFINNASGQVNILASDIGINFAGSTGEFQNSDTVTINTLDLTTDYMLKTSSVSSSFTNNAFGILKGNGKIQPIALTHNSGTLAPGASPGTITFDNDEDFANSTLEIEVDGKTTPGTDFDQIIVDGVATLGGALEVLVNFSPTDGDVITILDATSLSGTFSSVSLPQFWSLSYDSPNAGEVSLTYAPPPTCNDQDLKIATIYGTGIKGFAGDGGLASEAQFGTITDITLDANGNIFVLDAGNGRIRKIDAATGIVTTIAGIGGQGFSGDGGQATAAEFNFPRAIRFDANGDLYIADANNNRIRKVDMTTGIISTVVGNGSGGFGGDGGPATGGSISHPAGIVFNSAGELIFTDSNNSSLRKVDVSGNIQTIHSFAFSLPQQLLIDGNDDIYISDFLNRQIKKLDASNSYAISVFAGDGTSGYSGDGGLATAAQITIGQGASMALDADDNLYFADVYSHAIRKVDASSGIITTIAGTGTAGYSGDNGLATQATLNAPYAIAFNPANELLIADSNNDAIRVLSCQNDCTVAITDISTTYGSCLVQGNSQITVTATCSGCTNGTADLEYSIDGINFQSSTIFSNLKDSTYTVIVRNLADLSCRSIAKITLDQDFENDPANCCDIAITNVMKTDESCIDAADGNLEVKATCASCSNGVADIEYSKDGTNFQDSSRFVGLADGEYYIQIRDVNNPLCTALVVTTIQAGTVACCDLEITSQPTDQEVCDGDDATFNVTATTSATPLTYQWQQVAVSNMWTAYNPSTTPNFPSIYNHSVYVSNGTVYAGTAEGVATKPVGASIWTIYNETNGPTGFPNSASVQAVFEKDGVIYAAIYGGGLATLDVGNNAASWTVYNTTSTPNLPTNNLSDVHVSGGIIYVASGFGISMLDIGNGATSWTTIGTSTGNPSGLSNGDVRSVHVDNGVLYAATFNGGLSSWDFGNGATSWTVYNPTTVSPSGFPHITVRDVYTDNGTIYVATYGGIATLANGASSWTVYNTTTGPTGLPLDVFSSVHVDEGVIYAGMQGGGMAWLDVANNATSWETATQNQMGFPSTIVFDVFAINGNKYAATYNGIAELANSISDISGATDSSYSFTPLAGDVSTYQVVVTDANSCEVTSAAVSFTNVGAAPDIAPIATQMNICSTATVDLTLLTITDNNSVSGTTTTFHSAMPSSATDLTNQLSSTTISADQTVYVMVANTTTGCFDVESFMVDIVDCCDIFISHPESVTICDGEDVTFTATVTSSATILSYQWKKICMANGVTDTMDIVGATAPTYTFTPQAGDEDCIYRLVVFDAICAGISGSASFNILAPGSCCDMTIGTIGTQTNCPSATLDLTSVSIPVTNNVAGTDTTFHSAAPSSASDMSNQLSSTIVSSSQTVYVMVANVTTGCMAVSVFLVDITTNCNSSDDSFDLSGTLSSGITYVYNACDNIISEAIIPNATDVDYLAGEYIILKPGFHAQTGSDFLAKIVPCAPLWIESETRQAPKSNVDLAPSVELDLTPSAKVYPNPMRDYTRIEINLPQELAIQLDLYDMSGRKITNLVNGARLPAGVHHFDWQVQQVNGGMYLLVLNGQVVSKLAVIK